MYSSDKPSENTKKPTENDQSTKDDKPTNNETKNDSTNKETKKPDENKSMPEELGGPQGPEPTRYGDWEKNGRCFDF